MQQRFHAARVTHAMQYFSASGCWRRLKAQQHQVPIALVVHTFSVACTAGAKLALSMLPSGAEEDAVWGFAEGLALEAVK